MSPGTLVESSPVEPSDAPEPAAGGGRSPVALTRGADALTGTLLYLVCFAVALGVAGCLVLLAGGHPMDVASAMVRGSVGSASALTVTLTQAAPILIVSMASIVAFKAGMVNIGTEGQLVIGGVVGAWVGLESGLIGAVNIPLILLSSALGGAIWAGIAAVMQYWRGVNVVISTLLLNFIAYEVLSLAVTRSWWLQETKEGAYRSPQSDALPQSARLPRLDVFGISVHLGVIIALAAVVLVSLLLARTPWGFRVRMLGLNQTAARAFGVKAAIVGGATLLISGALAGAAGGVMLTGSVYRVQSGFSTSVGWDGLIAAIVARRRPGLAIPVALFFGALRAGGGFLASTGIARYLVDVVQALLILAAIVPPVLLERRCRRQIAAAVSVRA